MEQSFDALIAFNMAITTPDANSNKMRLLGSDTLESASKIIEIDWCSYDIKQQIVTDEVQYYIKNEKVMPLNQETVERTGITNERLQSAPMLFDVVQAFNDYVYTKFIRSNQSFCLVVFADDPLSKILPSEATEQKIKLASHFFQYFDIATEFKKFCPQAIYLKTMQEMLNYLNLKPVPAETTCQNECKSIVRLVNMLVRGNHVFQSPKLLNAQHQLQPSIQYEKGGVVKIQDTKKYSTFIRGKQPDPFRNPTKKFYIRLRGLPYSAREAEVLEFLRLLRVYKEDITFLYDTEGRFSGEAYVKLHNESDLKEAVSYNLSEIGNRFIEVFETNENEYQKAKNSQFPDKRELLDESSTIVDQIVNENNGIIRMRGLPYSATEQDIIQFFKGYTIVENGIKRAIVGGKPSGECFVIFPNKEMSQQVMSLNLEKIGSRFIELFMSSVREFENFMQHNFINNAPNYSRDHMPNIPLEKRKSTLMIFGLPFNVTKEQITSFFNTFILNDQEVHLLNSHSGKFSGNALITFEDELEAQRALKTKNLAYLGQRYIELYEYR